MMQATQARARKAKWASVTVAIVFTAYMAVVFGLGLYLFSLLASEMRAGLRFGTQTIGIVTAAAQVSFLVAAFACPHLARRVGDGRLIVIAVLLAGALLCLMSRVGSATSMAVLIGLLAVCAAFMVIPTVGVITRTVAFRYRSQVNGLVSSGTAYGQFAAGAVAPWLVLDGGWRSVWLVMGIGSLSVAIAGWMALRAFAPAAFLTGGHKETAAERSAALEARIFNRSNVIIWALLASSGMASGPWQNYLSSYLADENGLSITVIGRLWTIVGFLGLFSGFAVGFLADRIGVKSALGLSYGVLALSALLVAVHFEGALLYAAAICFGSSFFAVYGLIPAYITKTVTERQATAVFAGANVCLGLGTAFGNLAGGYIPELSGSLQQVYFGVAGVALAGAVLVMLLPKEGAADPLSQRST